ncbi:hypothetical protein V496_06434, partial [Pseudogymnoascus sp. VKM F-4515 (FW-2607)]
MRQQETQLQPQRSRLGQREQVHPPRDGGLVGVPVPAEGDVQPVAESPHDGAVDEVEGDGEVSAMGGHAAEVQARDEEVEEEEFLPRLEGCEEFRQVVARGEEVEVAQQHAREEHGEEGAVDDVHAVVDEAEFAGEAGVAAAAREGEEGVEKRVAAAVEDEGEVLEVAVPFQQLVAVGALVLGVGPDPQSVPGRHVQEGRHNDGDVQAQPAPEQRGGEVIPQLAVLARLDQRERLRREHVPRDDEEDGDGEVPAAEEGAHKGQRREVVLAVVAEGVLEDLVGAHGVARPQVVVLPVDEEGGEAAQAVEVGGAPELCLGLAAAGAREEGGAKVLGPVLGDAREGGELGGGVDGDPFLAQEAVVLEGHFWWWW